MSINELIKQLQQADSIQKADEALRLYLNDYQIRSYAFTYYSLHPSSRRKLKYEIASKPLKAWHQYYLESGYEDIDQTLTEIHRGVLPLFWDVKEQLKIARTPRERKIREESIRYGIDKGISISIHGLHNDFASLVLHQRKGESSF